VRQGRAKAREDVWYHSHGFLYRHLPQKSVASWATPVLMTLARAEPRRSRD
jgi:hypothetical protein